MNSPRRITTPRGPVPAAAPPSATARSTPQHPSAARVYRVDDRPPLGVTLLSALQQVGVIAPMGLVLPLLVVQRMGGDQAAAESLLALSMLGLGLATLLQCARRPGLGSGYFAPAIFTVVYLPPTLNAAEKGGLPLVIGMTLFAGACQMIMSRSLSRLRPYLPAEIAGLAVTMIGVILGMLGFRLLFGLPTSDTVATSANAIATPSIATAIGAFALGCTIAVNIWAPSRIRIYAVLIALGASWIAAALFAQIDLARLHQIFSSHLFAWPKLTLVVPTFAPDLAFEFAMSALAASLRVVGDITTCQKINDPRWLRPEMTSLKRGVFADGLGTFLCGGLGTMGINTFSGSIGLSAATGIMSRHVGIAVGFIFIALAFIPGAIAIAGSIPMPISGAMLLFASAFVFVNGLQVILSRLLDNRKILVVGLGLMSGLSRDIFPEFFFTLPPWLTALIGSPLVAALFVAILLNLLFRIGVRSQSQFQLSPGSSAVDEVHAFCQAQGETWAARRDVMHRVTTALVEFAEMSAELVSPGHHATIKLSFDEFRIDAEIRYHGRGMPRSAEPIAVADQDELPAHIPLLIIGRMADKSAIGNDDGTHWLRLSFKH